MVLKLSRRHFAKLAGLATLGASLPAVAAEKGKQAYEEAVKQLVRFVTWFKDRPKDQRRDLHRRPPTMPIPWGQRPSSK